jgi:aspartate racemase
LGLIGGIGVGATIHYYEKLASACESQGRTLDMVMVHAETSRVLEAAQAHDRSGLAEYLAGDIRRLKDAGAEFAALPSVTTHFCIRELAAISPVSVLDIFKPLAVELEARSVRRAVLFGTRFVIESELFGQIDQVEFILPKSEEIDYIHKTYVDLALTGKGSADQHKGLTALAHTILKRDEVDAIVLAGTDLVVLFNAGNTDFPSLDCAALHIQEILKHMLDETSSVQT